MSKRIKVCVLGGSALATPKIFDVLGKLGAGASYDFVLYGRDEERLRLVKAVSEQIIAGYPGLDVTCKHIHRPGEEPGGRRLLHQPGARRRVGRPGF